MTGVHATKLDASETPQQQLGLVRADFAHACQVLVTGQQLAPVLLVVQDFAEDALIVPRVPRPDCPGL